MVTRGATHVNGRRPVPGVAQATLFGFNKVVNLECPDLRSSCVDLDVEDETGAAAMLFEEICRETDEELVAFNGTQRYVARLSRHAGAAELTDLVIRPDATYLITGGQAGLGLETAKWLVGQGARSLVLA